MLKKQLSIVLAFGFLISPLAARADGPTDPTPTHRPTASSTSDTAINYLRSIFHI